MLPFTRARACTLLTPRYSLTSSWETPPSHPALPSVRTFPTELNINVRAFSPENAFFFCFWLILRVPLILLLAV